ncbi:TetR/AcrR family transcriptional regulator [Nocardia arizonensis]|uniref:TetR/AcrR family transcriptional regulator n=1 Tax=Nocardia arizonensis TaxID=1141647 RepID=UPI0006D1DBCB|nr:TetR/AcrR family transcriptional regulator [Nocardia arizonensis]
MTAANNDEEATISPDQENRRGRRTRAALRAALAELVEERGFEAVTVGEISERAGITRTAFYRHYRDKNHLVEQIFDEAVRPLEAALPRSAAEERLRRLFDHIAAHDRVFRALLGPRGCPSFTTRVLRACRVPDQRPAHLGDDLVRAVLGGMLTETIVWWLNHEKPIRSDELADRYLGMARALVHR